MIAQEATQIFEAITIDYINLDEAYEVTIVPQTTKVVITGEEIMLTEMEIKAENLHFFVDLTDKAVGEHMLNVQFDEIEGISNESITSLAETVMVVISEK